MLKEIWCFFFHKQYHIQLLDDYYFCEKCDEMGGPKDAVWLPGAA